MLKFASREPINKGWSKDKKYCLTDKDGKRYLLRMSSLDQLEAKKMEFKMMQQIESLGVLMCKPLEFGICDEGVFSIQSWIDGDDAEEYIPKLPDLGAYNYGLEAGQILKLIHSIDAPVEIENWGIRFNKKMDRKIESYLDCPIKYNHGTAFIEYINENRYLLENRPQVYQHGDYHIGNMMIDRSGRLHIIDFDRNDYGDPWEEFNRIVWCARLSPSFASGMIDGYFAGSVPIKFWQLLALYISSNTLSSIPWAIPFGQADIETMLNLGKEVLTWYNQMQNVIPSWYISHI